MLALCCVGCGRFGFDEPRLEGARSRPGAARGSDTASATSADSDASAAGGGAPGSGSSNGGGSNGGASNGGTATGGSGGGTGPETDAGSTTPNPEADAGSPLVDAALPEPDLLPLPNDIVCSSFTGLLACNNFSGSASGVSVSTETFGPGASATTDEFFSGRTTGDMEGAHLSATFTAISSGALYLRFSAFVPSSFPIAGINLASIGDPSSGGDFGVDLNLVSDGHVEIKTSGDGAVSAASSTYTLPRDRWLCVLLKVEDIDNTTGRVHVLIDNTQIIAANDVDTLPAGSVTGASAGIDWTFFNQGPAAVYVDNFVLTRDHPGNCP